MKKRSDSEARQTLRAGCSKAYPQTNRQGRLQYTAQLSAQCNKTKQAQLMLTNPRDTFRRQSRSPNIAPFHALYSFLLMCNSNLSFTITDISDIRLQKYSDLEIRVRGHSRSLKVVPFDRLGMVSY